MSQWWMKEYINSKQSQDKGTQKKREAPASIQVEKNDKNKLT